jgi:hypothetical protein
MALELTTGGSEPNPTPGQAFELAVEGSGTQWVTFGHLFEVGEITGDPVLTTTSGGSVTHQAHVHCLHSDGSVRFCTFSAQVVGGQNYLVVDGTAPAGTARTVADLLAAIPGDIASVTLTGGVTGTATVRDLLESATNRARLNNTSSYYIFEQGPQMLGVVVAQDFSTHLRVSMHLRWYGGTTLWCGFLFENGYINLTSLGSKSYTAQMVLNGTTVATQAMTAPVHYNRAMWYEAAWSTGGTLYARLQGETWTASKGVPNYSFDDTPTTAYMNARIQTNAPMDNGDHKDDLDDTGEQDGLGILSRWDAAFITSGCDIRMRNNVLANARGGMSYNYSCIMDSLTGEHLSLNDRPTFSAQASGTLPSGWTSGTSPFDAGVTGTFPAHMPSVGYLAFAITGEYGYMRAMHGWASFTPHYSPTNRNHTFNGMNVRRFHWISSRGVGWSYRTVGHAAYITPDNHYLKTYYNNNINGNFGVDAAEFNSTYNAIGLVFSNEVEGFNGPEQYRLFMHNFLTQSCSHLVCDLGFTSGTAFTLHIAKFVAGLMGNTNEYKWNFAADYTKKVGTGVPTSTWYQTFTALNNDSVNVPTYATGLTAGSQALADQMEAHGDIPNNIAGSITGRPNEAGSYYANMQPAVAFLPALGITGGLQCWSRYISGETPDYSDKPQFNIVPRATTALAQAALLLGAGQCIKFGTIPLSVIHTDSPGFSVLQYMSSICYDPINRQMRLVGKRSSDQAPYRFLIYDEADDAWTSDTPVAGPLQSNQNGHGYDHNTIDPDTGIHYFRGYNSGTVYYWTPSTGVWGTLASLGSSPSPEIAGFLEWLPGVGVVYGDRRTIRTHPGASSPGTAWTIRENLGSVSGAYHAAAAYNDNSQTMLWGWGNTDNNSRKLLLSQIGTPASWVTTQSVNLDLGSSELGGLIAPDPVGRGFIGWKKETLSWRHYDTDGNSWSTLTKSTGNGATVQTGTPNMSDGATQRHTACGAIKPYRVIMYVQYQGSSQAPDVWLYRHS